jgi:hypothetical protein
LINFELSGVTGNGTIEILDITGKQIVSSSINGNSITINIADLTSGIYFVRIQFGELITTGKFIKN